MDLTHRCEGRERGVELRSGLNTGFSGVFLGPFQGLSHLNQRGFEPRDLVCRHTYGKRYGAPYRHQNGVRPEVQSLCEANAVVMGAAARVISAHAPEVMETMWEPVRAAPVIAPATVYPSPAQQQGCV